MPPCCCRFLLLFFLPLAVAAQNIVPLKFRQLDARNGLSQNHVNCILKDKKGFMWFGTDEGLNKYDGYDFTVYKQDPQNPTSISGNFVLDILEDHAGNFWIGTSNGLDIFDTRTQKFAHILFEGKPLSVREIFEDSKKQIWIGTTHGLYQIGKDKKVIRKYEHNPEVPFSLCNNFIYRIAETDDGDLWLATRDGLARFVSQRETFTAYKHIPGSANGLGAKKVKTVYTSSDGQLWVGTQGGGLSRYDRNSGSFITFKHDSKDPNSIGHDDILSIVEGDQNDLWVGTENGGISILNHSTGKFATYKNKKTDAQSLSNNSVYCLYRDDVGNIWVGTWSGGVNLLPRFNDKFQHFQSIPGDPNSLVNNDILSIEGDENNNIWLGTDGGGISRLNWDTKTFTTYVHDPANSNSPKSDHVICASSLGDGIVAFGYHRGGFDLLDTKTGKFSHYIPETESARLSGLSVHVIFKDSNKQLWVGSFDRTGLYMIDPNELYRFDSRLEKFVNFSSDPSNEGSLGGTTVYCMFEDHKGMLWIGTNGGLDRFDPVSNTFVHHRFNPKDKSTLSNNVVYSVMEDSKRNLWIGTGGGLNLYDREKGTFTSYTEADGLANNVVYGILEDDYGNLWFSSNKGITRFNPTTRQVRNYGISDGLQGNTFKPNAYFKNKSGEMFFGGSNGFNVFHPKTITDNTIIPPVSFTGLEIFNKPVTVNDSSVLDGDIADARQIRLNYDQSVFTIQFAALNYISPEENQYAYKLEGFDPYWNYVGRQRSATYTNLNPGKYTLLVKGSNNDGIWNERPASLHIVIVPPFWKTWWFRFVMVLFVVGCTLWAIRLRTSRIQEQKLKLKQKVKKRTRKIMRLNREIRAQADEIKNVNENLEGLVKERTKELEQKNKALKEYAFLNSHKVRGPVASILGLTHLISETSLSEQDKKLLEYLKKSAADLDAVIHSINDTIENGGEARQNETETEPETARQSNLPDSLHPQGADQS